MQEWKGRPFVEGGFACSDAVEKQESMLETLDIFALPRQNGTIGYSTGTIRYSTGTIGYSTLGTMNHANAAQYPW